MKRLPLILMIVLMLTTLGQANEVRTTTLENGLEVVMMPDASSPLLSSLLTVKTGSAYEVLATAGSTHMLEHMIFRGTTTRSQGEIYDAFDRMGAYYNAHTDKSYTNFILVTPVEYAAETMELQADMILRSTIDADTFEVEKGRVLAEIQQSWNRASYPAEIAHLRHVYGDTPYGFPTLGSYEGIRNLGHDVVKQFHDDWYVVNNMTLVLRGDLTFKEMEELAEATYGTEAAKTIPKRPEVWPVGFDSWQQGQAQVNYGDVKSGTVQVTFQAPRFDDPDMPAYSIIASKLNDQLDAVLRGGGGMPSITYVYAGVTQDPSFSVLDVTAGLMPGADPQAVVQGILDAVHSMAVMEFTDEGIQQAVLTDRRQELFFSEQVQYGAFLLVPKLAVAPWGFWETYEVARDGVTARDAAAVASRWFSQPFFVASAFLPRPDESTGDGITLGDVVVDTLENGMVVAVRQVANAPVAGIHLVAKNRALLEGPKNRGWADLLHRLLTEEESEALNDEMEEIGMEMQTVDDSRVPMDDYRTTPEYSYVRIQTIASSWAEAVDLLGRRIGDDTIDEAALEKAVTELKGIIDRGKGNVNGIAASTMEEHLYGDNVMALPVYGDGSSLEMVNVEELSTFRDAYFAPNNLILTILAPAPPQEMIGRVQQAFGDLTASDLANPTGPMPVVTPGEETVTGRGRQGYLATGFLLKDVVMEDRAALMVANNMISSMIYRDLGEAKGWAYGAGSHIVVREGWGAFSSSMGLPEEHLEESKKAIYDHVQTVAKGDFDQKALDVAKGDLRGGTLRRYSSRINLAMAMGRDLAIWSDPLDTWTTYEAVQAVTLDDVKRVAKKYLSKPQDVVTIYGTPEKSDDAPKMMPGMGGMGGMGH